MDVVPGRPRAGDRVHAAGSTACSARTDKDGNPAAVAGGAVLEADGTIRQAGYFFSLFRRDVGRSPAPACRRSCSTSTSRCCARSAPSCSSSAASGSSASGVYDDAARRPARRRWTTACASTPRAVSASWSRPSALARLSTVDGEPDEGVPSAEPAPPQARGRELPTVEPGGRLMTRYPQDGVPRPRRQRRLLLPLLPARDGPGRRVRDLGRRHGAGPGRPHRRPRHPPPSLEDLPNYEVVVIQYATGRTWLQADPQAAGRRRHRALRDRRLRAGRAQEQDARARPQVRLRPRQGPRDGHARRRRDDLLDGVASPAATARSTANTWECRNGIDLNRYAWKQARPPRHGHDRLGRRRRPQGLAGALGARDPRRSCASARTCASSPSATPPPRRSSRSSAASARSPTRARAIEVYPATMTLFDVSFAPSAENNQFRGKSDLRWLEASARWACRSSPTPTSIRRSRTA